MTAIEITLADIRKAAERIHPYIHRTPVLACSGLDGLVGARVFLKCENFQRTGAFKIRGACNTIMSLPDDLAARGVVTSSSGNHAQGVALAARLRGIVAHIAMPETAPEVKKAAVINYGARVSFCEWTLEALDKTADRIGKETGATFVHPFNSLTTIAGAGTVATELLEEVSDLDAILVPVGGGGLISGIAIAVSEMSPRTRVIGVEPEMANDAYQSLMAGRILPARPPRTVADGLRTSLGDLTFSIIQKHVNQIVTVSEESIVSAMRFVWERVKIIIEPSAAVPVAAMMGKKVGLEGQRVGIILSGGNTDLDRLPWIFPG